MRKAAERRSRPPSQKWEALRVELEGKVAASQAELSGMRKWCLAALGEAEKRTAALREQNAGLQRRLAEEARKGLEAQQAAEATSQKLQEEKKLKLMVYGQTLAKHKEMAEESEELYAKLRDEAAARERAEAQLEACEEARGQMQTSLESLESEFQLQLTKQHEEAARQGAVHSVEMQELRGDLSAAQHDGAEAKRAHAALEEGSKALSARTNELESASTAKDQQVAELRASAARLNARVDEQAAAILDSSAAKQDAELSLARETEAQRHLKDRVAELTRLLQVKQTPSSTCIACLSVGHLGVGSWLRAGGCGLLCVRALDAQTESERLAQTQEVVSETESRLQQSALRCTELTRKHEEASADVRRLASLQVYQYLFRGSDGHTVASA
jgi:DNA repair exonuclease SbcCD ATPase subunit